MAGFVVEKKFMSAAAWALVACFLSMIGIIHSYELNEHGVVSIYGVAAAPQFGLMYAATAVMLIAAHYGELMSSEEEFGYKEAIVRACEGMVNNLFGTNKRLDGSFTGSVYSFTSESHAGGNGITPYEDHGFGGEESIQEKWARRSNTMNPSRDFEQVRRSFTHTAPEGFARPQGSSPYSSRNHSRDVTPHGSHLEGFSGFTEDGLEDLQPMRLPPVMPPVDHGLERGH